MHQGGLDRNELVDILLDRFPTLSRDTICDTLKENDWRLGPSEQALEAVVARQGSHGASSSQTSSRYQPDEREAQIRRDALLARSMQSHSISDGPPRGMGSNAADDSWTETINAVSSTLEENMRTAVNYASAFSGWASNLIANLDPTTLLFEDDEDYDYPGRPPPDKTKDKEGVSLNRTPLNQRSRGVMPPPPPPEHSEEEEEEEEEEDVGSPAANIASWLGGDDDVSYAKKDK